MMEILGTILSDGELIGALVGAVVGAVITGYALYVVAKVKHDNDVQEAVNEARIAGEEYPSWKVEKAGKWYKGYKLALVELIVLSVLMAFAVALYVKHTGHAAGCLEMGAVGVAASVVLGYVLDVKIIHPMADGSFMEQVETPAVEAFLRGPDEVDPAIVEAARKLRDKGLI